MASEAKLKGNARYLSKFKTLSVRIPAEVFPAFQAAAERQGKSASGRAADLIAQAMQAEAAGGYLIYMSAESAKAKADHKGQSLDEWLQAHQTPKAK